MGCGKSWRNVIYYSEKVKKAAQTAEQGDLHLKEFIDIGAYAQTLQEALPKGILLNTRGDKFNAMVIGWGGLGVIWGQNVYTVYVRQSRYTKAQLDRTGEFTISAPLGRPVSRIAKVCGSESGYDVDKVQAAGLTLEPPEVIHTPGIREYPLTLECRVLYRQDQALDLMPEDVRARFYPDDTDFHTAYIGQIVSAYIIK